MYGVTSYAQWVWKWDKHPVETMHAESCKSIRTVKRNTPNNACTAELGQYALLRLSTIFWMNAANGKIHVISSFPYLKLYIHRNIYM